MLPSFEARSASALRVRPSHCHFYNAAAKIAKGRQAFRSISSKSSTQTKVCPLPNPVAACRLPPPTAASQKPHDPIGIERAFAQPVALAQTIWEKRGTKDGLLDSRRPQAVRPVEPALRLELASTPVLPALASHDSRFAPDY